MAEYNPSKIIKDGNTYNFRDTTKIPLAGTTALAGSIVPSTDNSVDLGSSSKNIKMLYTKGITINGTQFSPSDYIPSRGGPVFTRDYIGRTDNTGRMVYCGGGDNNGGACVLLYGKDSSTRAGEAAIQAYDGANDTSMRLYPNGTLTWGSKNIAMQEDVVPRSGGAVMTGGGLYRNTDTDELYIGGGNERNRGGSIFFGGASNSYAPNRGIVGIAPSLPTQESWMFLRPDGTWTWSGQPVQTSSDRRLKQQITEIDDKLLDAWEDVDLVQFKYNDAVDTKKDNARLHTGYVVQQIDEACKSHNVDISAYGLYCHEEYPEETEEVEVEQADGTKTKEKKVIREASEHYSLRYTEALIVECAYLRKKLKELTARIEELEKGNKEEVK